MVPNLFTSKPTEIIKDECNARSLHITPVVSTPLLRKDWFRWNFIFRNYAGIDVMKDIIYFANNGYRVYPDILKEYERNNKCSFVLLRTGIVTMSGYFGHNLINLGNEECMTVDTMIPLQSIKTMRLLGLQRETPTDWHNQILVVNDKKRKSKYLTICKESTIEEHMANLNVVDYEIGTMDQSFFNNAKYVSILTRPPKYYIRSTCRQKEGICFLCDRSTCKNRMKSPLEEEIQIENNYSALDLL